MWEGEPVKTVCVCVSVSGHQLCFSAVGARPCVQDASGHGSRRSVYIRYMCVSLCTCISFNQSSGLFAWEKNRWRSYAGERCIAFLWGGEEDGYPFCVNTLSVVLIKCYYYISWFTPRSTPLFCMGMAAIKMYIQTYLRKCFSGSPWTLIKERSKVRKNNNESCKAHCFWHPTVEKPPLILTGIVCLHSTTNAPFTVVTPNRAYQISRTLGKSNQHAKEKLLSPHVNSWTLPPHLRLHFFQMWFVKFSPFKVLLSHLMLNVVIWRKLIAAISSLLSTCGPSWAFSREQWMEIL